jgi:spore photoproduct lyase
MAAMRAAWEQLKQQPTRYPPLPLQAYAGLDKIRQVEQEKQQLGLGWCPVASERTRCCNLLTLDAVENCGFDCSYCSIQSFYHGNKVRFDPGFADKLARLPIDPEKTYHIGTGQSSDSLMWGNKGGVLDALCAFAERHPNVILELKSKSKNVAYLCREPIPANMICTWSLNTPTLIAHEEKGTAQLEDRLNAARRVADRGVLVGFHFHPMIHYEGWEADYADIFARLVERFSPDEVALVSLGTLTFIKPVIKQIRSRDFNSRILQMPLIPSDGKLTYPDDTKLALFRHAYQGLRAWRNKVFFYLCMENQRFWEPVFGFDYPDNQALEQAMKGSYLEKIQRLRTRRSAA